MTHSLIKKTICTLACSLAMVYAQADTKPGVTILATGGTIAGAAASATDTTGYKAGALAIDTLINAVPQIHDAATVKGEQIASVASGNINTEVLLKLNQRINALLTTEKQTGIVITHGTDTIEETAFFLDLTTKFEAPIIVVGAMRPATAISADGAMNLLESVTLATTPEAKNRGVMIVLNDRISSPFYTSKTNSVMTDTFKATEQGYLGAFIGGKPKFYYQPSQPTGKLFFDVSKYETLPRVDVIYTYQEQDNIMIDAAIKNGAKGIVVASAGNGGMTKSMQDALIKAMEQGVIVVLSTRTGNGATIDREYGIGAGFLNPQKARILLHLALAEGADKEKIKAYFSKQ